MKVNREEFIELVFNKKLDRHKVCDILGISERSYYNYLKEVSLVTKPKPEHKVTLQELKDLRRKVFGRKRAKEEYYSNYTVKFRDNKPIGILHFGDMHMDSDGVDLDLIDSHINLLRTTEGLYGGNLGDSTNNWVGFLGKLYAEQHTTEDEAIALLQEYLGETHWLYTIIGNHDKWNHGDFVIKSIVNTGVVGEDVRLVLSFANGTITTIHASHNFVGNSMYNPAHGAVKVALTHSRDDIVIHGHKHSTGYSTIVDSEKHKLLHCLSVGSYKEIDSYKTQMGFRDDNVSPTVLTIIDPRLPETHPDRIKVFYDPFEGAAYLTYLRSIN